MKAQADFRQYTIRGIPAEVDRALRTKAARRKQSLNQVILDELSAATLGTTQKADFKELVGQWTPDPQFDEIINSQRRIDREKWK
jgi:plasmid stability protein